MASIHKWALWDSNMSCVVKRVKELPTADQSVPTGMAPNLEWLLIEQGVEPTYDPTTERVVTTQTNLNGKLVLSYTKELL